MEKVRLTAEEAAFVEEWNGIKTRFANIALALTEGYELESEQSEFKAGDKVVHKELEYGEGQAILTLQKKKMPMSEEAWHHGRNEWDYAKDFRHATPEEIYWLETLGREKVGDFREGDVLKQEGQFLQVFENMGCDVYGSHVSPEFAAKLYSGGLLYALSTAESFKPFPKEELK